MGSDRMNKKIRNMLMSAGATASSPQNAVKQVEKTAGQIVGDVKKEAQDITKGIQQKAPPGQKGQPSAPATGKPDAPAAGKPGAPATGKPSVGGAAQPSGGGAGGKVSKEQILSAVKACGFAAPPDDHVSGLVAGMNANSWAEGEAAMFLAQIMHESGGLALLEEQACKQTKCPGKYKDANSVPGKSYYGRGFIQLTWAANYKAAGAGIGMGEQLLQNPDTVAQNKEVAAKTSIWFWKTKVMAVPAAKTNFGATTKVINGAIECGKGPNANAQKRWQFYLKIAKILGVKNLAKESGCYN